MRKCSVIFVDSEHVFSLRGFEQNKQKTNFHP